MIMAGLVASCSQILQSVDLKINTKDSSAQEDFSVVEKTLTLKEARKQKNTPYSRTLLKNGRGDKSQSIPEQIALASKFPKDEIAIDYKIGVGDTVTFSKLIENNRSTSDMRNKWPEKIRKSNYKLGIGDTLALTLIKRIKSEPKWYLRVMALLLPLNRALIKPSIQQDVLDQTVVSFC
jgi:hypothetical protein